MDLNRGFWGFWYPPQANTDNVPWTPGTVAQRRFNAGKASATLASIELALGIRLACQQVVRNQNEKCIWRTGLLKPSHYNSYSINYNANRHGRHRTEIWVCGSDAMICFELFISLHERQMCYVRLLTMPLLRLWKKTIWDTIINNLSSIAACFEQIYNPRNWWSPILPQNCSAAAVKSILMN